jgi:hypothetical protein
MSIATVVAGTIAASWERKSPAVVALPATLASDRPRANVGRPGRHRTGPQRRPFTGQAQGRGRAGPHGPPSEAVDRRWAGHRRDRRGADAHRPGLGGAAPAPGRARALAGHRRHARGRLSLSVPAARRGSAPHAPPLAGGHPKAQTVLENYATIANWKEADSDIDGDHQRVIDVLARAGVDDPDHAPFPRGCPLSLSIDRREITDEDGPSTTLGTLPAHRGVP